MPFKFDIDPATETGRDTLCQTLRIIHRRFEELGDDVGMHLTAKSFDFAKRMNAKLQANKISLGFTGPAIKDGHPDCDD